MDTCAVCGKKEGLKRCAKCKSVVYCSQVCQKKDWSRHQQKCETETPATAVEVIRGQVFQIPDELFAPRKKGVVKLEEAEPKTAEQQKDEFLEDVFRRQYDRGLAKEVEKLYNEAREELSKIMKTDLRVNSAYVNTKLDVLLDHVTDAFNVPERLHTPVNEYHKNPERDMLRVMEEVNNHIADAINTDIDVEQAKEYDEDVEAYMTAVKLWESAGQYVEEFEVPLLPDEYLDAFEGKESSVESDAQPRLIPRKRLEEESEEEVPSERALRQRRRTAKVLQATTEITAQSADERNGTGVVSKTWKWLISFIPEDLTFANLGKLIMVFLIFIAVMGGMARVFGTTTPEVQSERHMLTKDYVTGLNESTLEEYMSQAENRIALIEEFGDYTFQELVEDDPVVEGQPEKFILDQKLDAIRAVRNSVDGGVKKITAQIQERLKNITTTADTLAGIQTFNDVSLSSIPTTKTLDLFHNHQVIWDVWTHIETVRIQILESDEDVAKYVTKEDLERERAIAAERIAVLQDPGSTDEEKISKVAVMQFAVHSLEMFLETQNDIFLNLQNTTETETQRLGSLERFVLGEYDDYNAFVDAQIASTEEYRRRIPYHGNMTEKWIEAWVTNANQGYLPWQIRHMCGETFNADMQIIFSDPDSAEKFTLGGWVRGYTIVTYARLLTMSFILGNALMLLGGSASVVYSGFSEDYLSQLAERFGAAVYPITALLRKLFDLTKLVYPYLPDRVTGKLAEIGIRLALTQAAETPAAQETAYLAGTMGVVGTVSYKSYTRVIMAHFFNLLSGALNLISEFMLLDDFYELAKLRYPGFSQLIAVPLVITTSAELLYRAIFQKAKSSTLDSKFIYGMYATMVGAFTIYAIERFATYGYLQDYYTAQLVADADYGYDWSQAFNQIEKLLDKMAEENRVLVTGEDGVQRMLLRPTDFVGMLRKNLPQFPALPPS